MDCIAKLMLLLQQHRLKELKFVLVNKLHYKNVHACSFQATDNTTASLTDKFSYLSPVKAKLPLPNAYSNF